MMAFQISVLAFLSIVLLAGQLLHGIEKKRLQTERKEKYREWLEKLK
jgi:hypothetical protein